MLRYFISKTARKTATHHNPVQAKKGKGEERKKGGKRKEEKGEKRKRGGGGKEGGEREKKGVCYVVSTLSRQLPDFSSFLKGAAQFQRAARHNTLYRSPQG